MKMMYLRQTMLISLLSQMQCQRQRLRLSVSWTVQLTSPWKQLKQMVPQQQMLKHLLL